MSAEIRSDETEVVAEVHNFGEKNQILPVAAVVDGDGPSDTDAVLVEAGSSEEVRFTFDTGLETGQFVTVYSAPSVKPPASAVAVVSNDDDGGCAVTIG